MKKILANEYKLILLISGSIVFLLLAYFVVYPTFLSWRYNQIVVERNDMDITVTASGKITAEKIANLSFGTVGRINYFPFTVNDEVKEGQIVARIDTSDQLAVKEQSLRDYQIARWNLEQKKDDYDVNGSLESSNLTDTERRIIEQQQFQLDKSVFNVEIADRTIKNGALYAPFNGVITQESGELNQWTSAFPVEPLIQIVDFNTLFFQAEVNQEYSGVVKVGQIVTVVLEALPEQVLSGSVAQISSSTKTTSTGEIVVPVKIILDDFEIDLKLGWEGDAVITIEQKSNVVQVPKKAVINESGDNSVYLWQGNRLIKQPVTVGLFDGAYWEVSHGLSGGETLAIRR